MPEKPHSAPSNDELLSSLFDPDTAPPSAPGELPPGTTLELRAARMLRPDVAPGSVAVTLSDEGVLVVAWNHQPSPAEEAAVARSVGMPVSSHLVSPARFAELGAEAERLVVAAAKSAPVERYLDAAIDAGASDLHLRAGSVPYYRVAGSLTPIPGSEVLSAWDLSEIVAYVTGGSFPEDTRDHDCAVSWRNSRFRANIFRQRGAWGAVLRTIPGSVPPFESLHLPAVVAELAERTQGIVIVSGVTGSGKSTTLAALVDRINETRQENVITLEDPIEYVYANKRSLISQREVGSDTDSFAAGLRAALREDPDVILVGEMRDHETIEAAIRAAETGHLVFSTLHAGTVEDAINRIVDVYPSDQQRQIRVQLAASLAAVVCQRLVPATTPGVRRVATEVMVVNDANRNSILNPGNNTIASQLQTRHAGQHLMDHSLAELVACGAIDFDTARRFANRPADLAAHVRDATERLTAAETVSSLYDQAPAAFSRAPS